MRAGHYLRAVRACLRAPGEAYSQSAAFFLTVLMLLTMLPTVLTTRAFVPRVTRQVGQYGQLDLIAGQELGAPPSQRIPGPFAHQGQALTVGER